MYYCICPVCMCVCVCVLPLFCLMYWYTTAALLFLVPHKTVVGIIHLSRYPKPLLPVEGIFGLGTRLLPDQCSFFFFDLLTLLLGNWFWYTTAVRPTIHRGNTLLCCPNLALGSATLFEPHTNPVRSRGAHPRGCSRAPFPVDVPSIGAAAAALMGMVIAQIKKPPNFKKG